MKNKKTKKEIYGFIYITTNWIDGMKYIGQRKFIGNWQDYLGSGAELLKAVKKYGKENFTKEIIILAYDAKELSILERNTIINSKAVKSDNYYNLNCCASNGNSYINKTKEEMDEIRRKQSEAHFKKVKCITTGEIFNSILLGEEKYGVNRSSISACCRGKLKSAGKLNGEKLIWEYYKEEVE